MGYFLGDYPTMTGRLKVRFFARIREMIRLYFFCFFFDRYHARLGGTFQYYDDEIDKNEFLNHIFNERHFGMDIRDTLKYWIHWLTGVWILQGNNYTMQKTRRRVYDLLAEAKRREYLIESEAGKLRMDDRGRRFMKPLNFIEATLREYGYFQSVATTLILGVGGTIVVIFWNKVIALIAGVVQ